MENSRCEIKKIGNERRGIIVLVLLIVSLIFYVEETKSRRSRVSMAKSSTLGKKGRDNHLTCVYPLFRPQTQNSKSSFRFSYSLLIAESHKFIIHRHACVLGSVGIVKRNLILESFDVSS